MSYTLSLIDRWYGGESCDFIGGTEYEWRKGGFWCPPPTLKTGQMLIAGDPENRYEPREVRINLKIKGASEDALWASVEKINRILYLAREQYEGMLLPTVELTWKSTNATSTVYFLVIGGSLDVGPIEHLQLAQLEIPNCTLTVRCLPFARGVSMAGALIAVPLNNSSVETKTTDAVTVFNHDDATEGHDNWVDIVAADVLGDQPAEVRVEMTNHASSPNDLYRFHVAVRRRGTPGDFVFAHNAEDNIALGDDTSLADDATSPGTGGGGGIGQKAVCDFSGTATFTSRVKWRIEQDDVSLYEGIFRVYVAMRQSAGSPGDIDVRLTAYATQYVDGASKTLTVTGSYWPWVDMGLFAIPLTSFAPAYSVFHDLYVNARRTAGAGNLEVAAMVLVPVQQPDRYILATVVNVVSVTVEDVNQGHMVLHRSEYNPFQGTYVVDDSSRERLHLEQRGTNLFLSPSQPQRMFFAMAHTTQSDGSLPRYGITNRLQVQVTHNPRFLHVRGT